MTVIEIIEKYLEDNNYDGLYCQDCGCSKEELFPCMINEGIFDCKPGYKKPCNCGESCNYHIGEK